MKDAPLGLPEELLRGRGSYLQRRGAFYRLAAAGQEASSRDGWRRESRGPLGSAGAESWVGGSLLVRAASRLRDRAASRGQTEAEQARSSVEERSRGRLFGKRQARIEVLPS